MRRFKIFTVLLSMVISIHTANAADIKAGKQKAASCAGCHGVAGISANPVWPNLAGQNAQYLEIQLRSFREGKRQNPLMNAMAQTLSDTDIENLASYFSSLSHP